MELWIIITIIAPQPNPTVCGAKKNEISDGGFWGQLYPVFLCVALAALCSFVDLQQSKASPNHTNVLGVGKLADWYGWFSQFSNHSFNHGILQQALPFRKLKSSSCYIWSAYAKIVNFQVGLAIAIGVLAILMLSFHKSDAVYPVYSHLCVQNSLFWGWLLAHFWGSTVSFRAATDCLQVILCSEPPCRQRHQPFTNTFHGWAHVLDG